MKTVGFLLLLFLVGIIAYSFLSNPTAFFANITKTLEIWLYKVYPSIFTFYMLSSLLINTRIINKLIYYLRPFFQFLKFKNENALHLFILSIFVGNPTSASLICEALNKDAINQEDGNILLKCASFLNPFFIISFLSVYDMKYALLVIIAHVGSNFLITLALNHHNERTIIHNQALKFSLNDFLQAINKVIALLLMISGIMVFCNILKYSITLVLDSLGWYNTFLAVILANLEVAVGLNSIIRMEMELFPTLLLAAFLCSFGGVSIHLQVVNTIGGEKLRYSAFFKYRLLQAILSVLLVSILFLII